MIMKKIVFGTTEILVTNAYTFKYTNGKIVLRISAREEDTDEATLKLLQDNKEDIRYYESVPVFDENGKEIDSEYVLKETFECYTSGDYISSYSKGVYEVEIARAGETEQRVKKLENELDMTTAKLDYIAMMSDVEIPEENDEVAEENSEEIAEEPKTKENEEDQEA